MEGWEGGHAIPKRERAVRFLTFDMDSPHFSPWPATRRIFRAHIIFATLAVGFDDAVLLG